MKEKETQSGFEKKKCFVKLEITARTDPSNDVALTLFAKIQKQMVRLENEELSCREQSDTARLDGGSHEKKYVRKIGRKVRKN